MQGTIQVEEQARLRFVLERLRRAVQDLDGRLARYARDIQQEKTYLWESRADMDHVEKIFTRQTIEQSVMTGEAALAHRQRLARLLARPYFGRVDFVSDGGNGGEPTYIGIHHFDDGDDATALVHDWRAPVSTMFYDYETGPAAYESPGGVVTGRVTLKRQFQIRNGEIELMLDSAVNVMDDVLQRELSRSSDDRMKQIVATIQRDQNAIIRNSEASVLVIQGVAGSGKTSIALHRIAFLLYRYKETLQAKDILIISPNAVFSDYHELDTTEKSALRTAIRRMYRGSTLRAAYKNFYAWAGVPELYNAPRPALEHADVFPLIYLKLRLEGADTDFSGVKHLLVDEMQDYTPVRYAVIAPLFRCNTTILGDAHQGLNPYAGSSMSQIQQVLPHAVCVTLNTSYRSTFEITQFAQRISPNPDLVAIERHGDPPHVVVCRDAVEEMAQVCEWIDGFAASGHKTAGIVCKTDEAARCLHADVTATGREASLLSADSKAFAAGLIVCSGYVAKGLRRRF